MPRGDTAACLPRVDRLILPFTSSTIPPTTMAESICGSSPPHSAEARMPSKRSRGYPTTVDDSDIHTVQTEAPPYRNLVSVTNIWRRIGSGSKASQRCSNPKMQNSTAALGAPPGTFGYFDSKSGPAEDIVHERKRKFRRRLEQAHLVEASTEDAVCSGIPPYLVETNSQESSGMARTPVNATGFVTPHLPHQAPPSQYVHNASSLSILSPTRSRQFLPATSQTPMQVA
ncbi:hypothetical protein NUW54_g3741 [Trametes sanguinea]|uniref:Uncharacterized protein n=1 Tax=Trametes sanguinea TaxID=158606 RepID=A0ACC1Q114_9APHY|nr:hypothetical protein NUW54_g3741 [Trametes sanguinea]